jgi:hypothetical protein
MYFMFGSAARKKLNTAIEAATKRVFQKAPGTNKRRSRLRPESDLKLVSVPELAIVPRELWDAVQSRLNSIKGNVGNRTQSGLPPRGLTSPYLFSSMHPVMDGSRGWYYEAEGAWNLLGTDKNAPLKEHESTTPTPPQPRFLAPKNLIVCPSPAQIVNSLLILCPSFALG